MMSVPGKLMTSDGCGKRRTSGQNQRLNACCDEITKPTERHLGRSRNHIKLETIWIETFLEEICQEIDIIFQANLLSCLDQVFSAETPEFRVVPQQIGKLSALLK